MVSVLVQSASTLPAPPLVSPLAGLWRPLWRFVPVSVAIAALAAYTIHTVLQRCGHPAVPLDDAFIHFQYAKRLAQGHFFSYVDGEGYTSGATSLLWPVLLSVPWALGARDLSIVWEAWIVGFALFGAFDCVSYPLDRGLPG